MELLVRQGKVVYVGSSNFAGWDIARANESAGQRNFMGLVCEQSMYSLANRTIELEVIPACRAYGLGMIAYSPLAGGLLAGSCAQDAQSRRIAAGSRERAATKAEQIRKWQSLCDGLDEEPGHVALAWVLANADVTGPIIGPGNMEQLTGSMRALDIALDEAALQKLEEIWPGPGGEAPEAYAW